MSQDMESKKMRTFKGVKRSKHDASVGKDMKRLWDEEVEGERSSREIDGNEGKS
jgi:hypothetical protein